MSNQTDQEAFFAYSGGKSLSPAEQDAFHAGLQARADLAAEQKHELLMAIYSAYELLSQGNGMRALSVLGHTIDAQEKDDE